eukprot:5552815-Pyramimonas_sp.AAC.1
MVKYIHSFGHRNECKGAEGSYTIPGCACDVGSRGLGDACLLTGPAASYSLLENRELSIDGRFTERSRSSVGY